MPRKKLLLLTHCFPSDKEDLLGVFLFDFLKYLSAKDIEISVYTPKMNYNYDLEYMKSYVKEIHFFDWLGGDKRIAELKMTRPGDLLQLASMLFHGRHHLKKLLKEESFDFSLAPWVVPNGFFISSLSRKFNTPYALWALGSDINVYSKKPFGKSLLRYTLNRAHSIFANSHSLKETIARVYNKEAQLMYTNRTIPSPETEYTAEDKLKLVYVARLEKVKGPDLLIEAIKLSGIANFELTIVGDGSMNDEIFNSIKEYGFEQSVRFLGFQGPQVIANEINRADYLVISSYSEGMPVVFWEAMQCETPVLSTDVGDVKHYSSLYNVGKTSDISAEAFAELLHEADQNRELRSELSSNCSELSEIVCIKNSAETFWRFVVSSTEKKV